MAGKYAKRNDEGDHRIKSDDPRAIALLKEEHHIFRTLFDQAEAEARRSCRSHRSCASGSQST